MSDKTYNLHPVAVEALERCSRIDKGFAAEAAQQAEACRSSSHPVIRERAGVLEERAAKYLAAAKVYRDALESHRVDEPADHADAYKACYSEARQDKTDPR